jgi:hypothetical protein
MADYYTHCSIEIDDEYGSLAQLLNDIRAALDSGEPDPLLDTLQIEADECGFEFEWEAEGGSVWMYIEGSGSVEQIANVIQLWLKRGGGTGDPISIEWANTCSKMRTDGFNGGCVVITRNEQRWFDTGRAICELTCLPKGMCYEVTAAGHVVVTLPDGRVVTVTKDGVKE